MNFLCFFLLLCCRCCLSDHLLTCCCFKQAGGGAGTLFHFLFAVFFKLPFFSYDFHILFCIFFVVVFFWIYTFDTYIFCVIYLIGYIIVIRNLQRAHKLGWAWDGGRGGNRRNRLALVYAYKWHIQYYCMNNEKNRDRQPNECAPKALKKRTKPHPYCRTRRRTCHNTYLSCEKTKKTRFHSVNIVKRSSFNLI